MSNPEYKQTEHPSVRQQVPLVSIGLPVWNGVNYLSQALDSLLAQTFTDFELIISDNASQDETEKICREYAARDPRIIYVRQAQNIGAVGNFNFVFDQARGDYFKWASHDDICAPRLLEACVDVLRGRPDVTWTYSRSDMIDAAGNSWKNLLPDDDEELEYVNGRLEWKGHPRQDGQHDRPLRRFAGVLLGTRWCVDAYGLIRNDALRRTRRFVHLYGAEKVLMGELSLIGKCFMVPEQLFSQRIHSEASSCVDSGAAQLQFAMARSAKPFVSTRWDILRAHASAVRRAELSARERMACHRVLVRYILQITKWKHVLQTSLLGQGVGGGGTRIIKAATRSDKSKRTACANRG